MATAGVTPRFLATIDFGTTYCSVAYVIRPDPFLLTLLKLDNAGNRRVPSCILFDPSGRNIAFGHEAQEWYADLDLEERPQYPYFEHVKKHLQHEKVNVIMIKTVQHSCPINAVERLCVEDRSTDL